MYIDSISSFCSLVVDQPSTINAFLADSKKRLEHTKSDLIQQPSVTTVDELLDQLIHIGFGDLHFIKTYKSMDQNRKSIQEYCLRLEEKKKLARIRDKQIETLKQDIKERCMKLASNTIQDDADLEEHHHDSVLLVERSPKKQSRWAKQLEAALKKLDERQYELQTTTNQILQYQEKLDDLKSTLSHDDYVPTSNEVKDVLMKLCPAVAEYIRLQHKKY
jgi:chromosome segregation ATPase